MSDAQSISVKVHGGAIELRVRVQGSGPDLLYLHPAAGLAWDPFLDRLSQHCTIYAPEFPGTTPGNPYAVNPLFDLAEIVLVYEELTRHLRLDRPILMGQSFGGMLACELAATFTRTFSKLVVLDPVGLWREDVPVADWISAPPEQLPALLFKDPHSDAARAALALPEDLDARVAAGAALVWNLGCTGRFLWPIPDRGLSRRLHRIEIPTLIIWGDSDRLIPPAYAAEFQKRIAGSCVEIIQNSGHIPQLEQPAATFAAVSHHLGFPQR